MKKLIFIKLFLLGLLTSAFAGEMSISDGWIKAKRGQMTGAFLNIKNNTGFDDTLIGVKTKFAKRSEIHTVKIDSESNAKMMKIKSISIPDNKMIKLQQGGNHLMFMGLKENIVSGQKYNVTLIFENHGKVDVMLTAKKSHKANNKKEYNYYD
jgi:hypothetical protein